MLAPTATAVHRKRTLPFIHHHYVLLKAHYFLYFSAFGIIAPIMNLTLRSRGLSTVELSYINIIIPFLVFFTNPLLGYIADHTRRYLSTFNIVLVISIAVFSGIFMLPPVRSNLIRGTLHYDNHNNNFLLQFSGSPEVGRECALRSACGCSYNATCKSTHLKDAETFWLLFIMSNSSYGNSFNKSNGAREINYNVHVTLNQTLQNKIRISRSSNKFRSFCSNYLFYFSI